jgi:hypothetical protein
MAYFTVVDEKTDPGCAPPEGKCVLLGSHMPVPNKVFTFPPGGIPGCDTIYELIQGVPLQVGSTYELDFKVKGAGVRGANVVFEVLIVYVPKKRVSLGERRAVEYISEWFRYEDDFAAGPQWTTVRKRFTFEFKNAVLNKELTSANVTLRIEASLSFGRGRIYYDDVKLTRAP